ncbi:MAG: hypothetical protein AVDCRST_MAG28-1214 [uncultured Rubrobacteraceae bacterium]|uniref:Uncharacterized protein n=1 Tax=uncultured Rubrobacteraceae bacterium TaxID=349277 RepID=A0A6J4QXH9_9ACTN|nr:MAG: hypothetical protein AVDCRST_MAG28-1214 [uncultured Rubrobacteraceae bacterium]
MRPLLIHVAKETANNKLDVPAPHTSTRTKGHVGTTSYSDATITYRT